MDSRPLRGERMSAIRELAIFSEGHREIMAHKRFGELLRAADNEYEELYDKLDALKHYADVDRERIAALQSRIKELEQRLEVACHIGADDKDSFDWAVLGRIWELEQQNEAMKKVVEAAEKWSRDEWAPSCCSDPKCAQIDCQLVRAIEAYEQESA